MTTGSALPPLERLRTLHGLSTRAWATDLEIDQTHWIALSGAGHPDYNLALCHGPAGGEQVTHCIDTLTARRRPAILALAGRASELTEPLVAAAWKQVGSAPFMARGLRPDTVAPVENDTVGAARELSSAELPLARALIARTFGLSPELAEVALPVGPVDGRSVWGAFAPATGAAAEALMACTIAVRVEQATVIWSMATDPAHRRQGHGARVLEACLAGAGADGCELALLHASSDGEPFYRAHGYDVLERWAFWSRPRWVLAAG